jgi:hypothetical protein
MARDRTWRLVGVGVVAVVVVIGGTIVLERLFRESGRAWSAAVQATFGIILTVATAAYATLTYRLLQVTEKAPRVSGYHAAAAQVATALLSQTSKVLLLGDRFPIDTSGTVTRRIFSDEDHALAAKARDALEPWAMHLPPSLIGLAMDAITALTHLHQSLLKIDNACGVEGLAHKIKGEEASWQDVEARYYATIRGPDFSVEWKDLIAGEAVTQAQAALDNLLTGVTGYLAGVDDRRIEEETNSAIT